MDKTKTMTLNDTICICNIVLKGSLLEDLDTFQNLGSLITEHVECSKDVRGKLAKGMSTGAELKQIWKSHSTKLTTKLRLMKALVWPVAAYGYES